MAQVAVIKVAPTTPNLALGYGMTELIKRLPITVKSDAVTFADTAAISLIELPGNALITDAQVRVTTAFDASGTSAAATATLTVPNDTGTETLFDSANVALQSTGFKPATTLALVPASGGFAILNLTPGTAGAGALEVYLSYIPNADLL